MNTFHCKLNKSYQQPISNDSPSFQQHDHHHEQHEQIDSDSTAAEIDEQQLAQDMQSLEVVEKADDVIENHAAPSPSVSPSNLDQQLSVDDGEEETDTGFYKHHQPEHEYFNNTESQAEQQFFRNKQRYQQQMEDIESHVPHFHHYNKRQTGKKNVSNIVVGTDDKIEFDQVDDKGFGVVKINRPIGASSRSSTHEHLNDNESVNSHDSQRTHTAEGHFDLKFYSHRLW
jgi:alpha-tubulin N-acetyltransferase 1